MTNKGKICVIAIEEENSLEFFKLYPKGRENSNGKKEFLVLEKRFPKDLHKTTITKVRYNEEIDVAVTFAKGSDTTIKAWSSSGDLLHRVNTNQVKHNICAFSLDLKFLAMGAWTPDGRIFEIEQIKRKKEFVGLKEVMATRGHRNGVTAISISNFNRFLITFSTDNTLKIWNIDVRYKDRASPECIADFNVEEDELFADCGKLTAVAVYKP